MKRSTLIMILVCVVLLVAAVLINERPAQRGSERLEFSDLSPETIDGLVLEGSGNRVVLARSEGAWRLENGHLADTEIVTRAIEGLQAIDTSDVVSASEERQARYGVDAESGTTIEAASGGKKVVRVVIGASESGEAYVREVGEDAIFAADPSLVHRFPLDEKRWLKLNLVDGKLEDVQSVRIDAADGASFTIEPITDSDEWRIGDPSALPADFRFDGVGARSLANAAVTVRAKDLVEDEPAPEVTGLAGAHDRVTLKTVEGDTVVHLGATTESGDVYARVDGRDALFLLPSYQANNMRKKASDLRDLRLMDFDATAATALRIGAGREVLSFVKEQDGAWSIDPEGPQPPVDFPFDPASVDRLVRSLAGIKANAPAEEIAPKAAGLIQPSAQVAVTLADDQVVMLEFGKEIAGENDQKLVYARGNADDRVYVVAGFHLDRFARGWESFKVVEPPPNMPGGGNPWGNLDPETLKNLPPEVRQQILQQMQQEQQKQRLMQQLQAQQGGASS